MKAKRQQQFLTALICLGISTGPAAEVTRDSAPHGDENPHESTWSVTSDAVGAASGMATEIAVGGAGGSNARNSIELVAAGLVASAKEKMVEKEKDVRCSSTGRYQEVTSRDVDPVKLGAARSIVGQINSMFPGTIRVRDVVRITWADGGHTDYSVVTLNSTVGLVALNEQPGSDTIQPKDCSK